MYEYLEKRIIFEKIQKLFLNYELHDKSMILLYTLKNHIKVIDILYPVMFIYQ